MSGPLIKTADLLVTRTPEVLGVPRGHDLLGLIVWGTRQGIG
jgi:hypothetical protein